MTLTNLNVLRTDEQITKFIESTLEGPEEKIPLISNPGSGSGSGFWTREAPQKKPSMKTQSPVEQGQSSFRMYKIVHRGRLIEKIEIALKKGFCQCENVQRQRWC